MYNRRPAAKNTEEWKTERLHPCAVLVCVFRIGFKYSSSDPSTTFYGYNDEHVVRMDTSLYVCLSHGVLVVQR